MLLSQGYTTLITPFPSDERFTSLSTTPKFAIGQRAILIRTPAGNLLWDCLSVLDPTAIEYITKEGGLGGIVISHPHYYSTHLEWAEQFRCPVYLAEEDKAWLARESGRQVFLRETETKVMIKGVDSGVKVVKLGGHFEGSCRFLLFPRYLPRPVVLLVGWCLVCFYSTSFFSMFRRQGDGTIPPFLVVPFVPIHFSSPNRSHLVSADRFDLAVSVVLLFDGRLLIADTLMTTPSGLANWKINALGEERERPKGANSFAFMWSIPNMIPLGPDEIVRMWDILKDYHFISTHGAFVGQDIEDVDVKARVLQSMQIQIRSMGYREHHFLHLL